MEREREHAPQREAAGGDAGPDPRLDEERARLEAMLDKADKMLDSITADQAEEYLQQSRQRGAE
jgi:hypothetical protein